MYVLQKFLNHRKKLLHFRSSRLRMFFKIGVVKNFTKFTGKQMCWSLFLIRLQAWKAATILKRDSNTGVFLCNLRNWKCCTLQNTSGGCFCSYTEIKNYIWNTFIVNCKLKMSYMLIRSVLKRKTTQTTSGYEWLRLTKSDCECLEKVLHTFIEVHLLVL